MTKQLYFLLQRGVFTKLGNILKIEMIVQLYRLMLHVPQSQVVPPEKKRTKSHQTRGDRAPDISSVCSRAGTEKTKRLLWPMPCSALSSPLVSLLNTSFFGEGGGFKVKVQVPRILNTFGLQQECSFYCHRQDTRTFQFFNSHIGKLCDQI